jgi:hypothetical protein
MRTHNDDSLNPTPFTNVADVAVDAPTRANAAADALARWSTILSSPRRRPFCARTTRVTHRRRRQRDEFAPRAAVAGLPTTTTTASLTDAPCMHKCARRTMPHPVRILRYATRGHEGSEIRVYPAHVYTIGAQNTLI